MRSNLGRSRDHLAAISSSVKCPPQRTEPDRDMKYLSVDTVHGAVTAGAGCPRAAESLGGTPGPGWN